MRQSALSTRHRALGAQLDGATWSNMPVPWSYSTDPNDEHVAVRTRAGLYDMSALNIVHVSGPDALLVLDYLVSCDVTKLKPGMAALGAELNEEGSLCDDIMVLCDAPDRYRVSHGEGETRKNLIEIATGRDVTIEPDYDVHTLSLQGPRSLAILEPHTAMDLAALPYFAHRPTRLFGKDVVIFRGGYSGERGYEIACSSSDAVHLWDNILERGAAHGAVPCSWTSLELVRVESALLFFPYDMPEGDTTPWEVNMGWAIARDKGEYRGRKAVMAAEGKERVKQAGIECKYHDAVEPGATLYRNGRAVGVVTSPAYSRYTMKSLALVHLKPDCTALGTQVEVRGVDMSCTATVVQTPFYDPMRLRTHPEKLER